MMPASPLLPLLAAAQTPSAAQPPSWNPLAGLPPLPLTHHSWPICRDGVQSSPCPTPIDAANPAMVDYARITHAFPLSVAFGGQWEVPRPWPLNTTELREAVKICARTNASLSLNYSPWYAYWEPHCRAHCDPTSTAGEAQELRFYSGRLREIAAELAAANKELGSRVRVGAVLLDSEKFTQGWDGNSTVKAAITRKHNLMYDATSAVFPHAVIEQYGRGTMEDEKSVSHTATSEAWAFWPVCALRQPLICSPLRSLITLPTFRLSPPLSACSPLP